MSKNTLDNLCDNFLNLIRTQNASKNDFHELELRFGNQGIHSKTSRIDYDNIIKTLKSDGFVSKETDGNHSLKISTGKYTPDGYFNTSTDTSMRVEILGIDAIQQYCLSNSLEDVMKHSTPKFIKKIYKGKSNTVKFDDFNFKVVLATEQNIPITDINERIKKKNWEDTLKTFRYMNRVSFEKEGIPFRIDLSIVQSSTIVRKEKIGKQMVACYNTNEAKVFENVGTYEIEVEIINDKIINSPSITNGSLATSILKMAKTILSGYQRTPYPISYPEQILVVKEYLTMINPDAKELKQAKEKENGWFQITPAIFVGPSPVTLQLVNIIKEKKENNENNYPNIWDNYTVTDKTDGERRMLYINKDGKIYFITNSMDIIFTGMKTTKKECFNSLLDGEYIMHDKNDAFYNAFKVFDLYFYQGKSVRKCPFMMTPARRDETNIKNTRYGLAVDIVKHLNIEYTFNTNIKDDDLNQPKKLTIKMKTFGPNYNDADQKKQSLNIFTYTNAILRKINAGDFEYKTDGLIFTPIEFGVGGNAVKEEGPLLKGAWNKVFKWKPPESNSIDFLVTTKKNKNLQDYVHTEKQYKKIVLRCGYNKNRSKIYEHPCKMMLTDDFPVDDNVDNIYQLGKYNPLRFYPTNPYNEMAGIANINLTQTENGMAMLTTDNNVFKDMDIVEFKYDITKPEGWQWIPIHVRYDKISELQQGISNYGNSFETANGNWYSMHNIITEKMLMDPTDIPEKHTIDKVYYDMSKKSFNTDKLRKFHNYVKTTLIESATDGKTGKTLIDFACGKGGDLYKWIHADLSFVFGIDIEDDNIHNKENGACTRYVIEVVDQISKRDGTKIPYALFVTGNSGEHIRATSELGSMTNHTDAMITRSVFGLSNEKDDISNMSAVVRQQNSGKNGFNISSCQFAIHYMFKDMRTFHTFLRNVSECTKTGGYFIGATYDGKTIYKKLSRFANNTGPNESKSGTLIWEILKEYGDMEMKDDHTSLGMAIKVFQDSINRHITEYLVNFDYLINMMEQYGFKLISDDEAKELNPNLPSGSSMFDDLYDEYETPKNKMRDYEKTISNLNRYFIFKKIRDINAKEVSDTYIDTQVKSVSDISVVSASSVSSVSDVKVNKIITRTGKRAKIATIVKKSTKSTVEKAKHKTAIIVPFRDTKDGSRGLQLDQFIERMTEFMGNNAYTIYIINQTDDGRKFNRGALLNVGYRLAIEDSDNDIFVFHDVDLLPNDALLPRYTTPPSKNSGVHISKMWDRYKGSDTNTDHYFGGIVSFDKETYKTVNGYPNSFWGWGGEDDVIRDRMRHMSILVEDGADIDGEGKITDLENLTLNQKRIVLNKFDGKTKAQFKRERVKQDVNNWQDDGVDQVIWNDKKDSIPDELKQISNDHVQIENVNIMPDVETRESSIDYVADYKKDTLENVETEIRLLDADLSDIPTNFENRKSCNDYKKRDIKIPFATTEDTFYELVPPDVVDFEIKNNNASPLELKMFNNLTSESIKNTFRYLFHKVRMGVFVYIKGGKLHRFVPFYNMDFENNWSDEIKDKFDVYDGKLGGLDKYIENKKKTLGKMKKKIDDYEKDITKWPTNNCMLGTWSGEEVGDLGWYETRDMFVSMCENHEISDCVFFYNRRDHPVLTVDNMEPYFHIYNGLDTPLTSHKYDTYSPIVGYSKNKHFADILIPTYSDWSNLTGKVYMSNCSKVNKDKLNIDWTKKKDVAVFRGSSTGCGSTPETNQRLGIAVLMKKLIENNDIDTETNKHVGKHNETDMFDVGLTGINTRDKKYSGENVKFIDPTKYTTVKKLTYEEQSGYKYIIHIDGHVSAFRLGKELSMGSCILKVDSLYDYKLWFSDKMIAHDYKLDNSDKAHYIRVDKDMSNLVEKVMWCKNNDSVCQQIAQNALKLHNEIFTEEYMTKYCADIVNSISLGYSSKEPEEPEEPEEVTPEESEEVTPEKTTSKSKKSKSKKSISEETKPKKAESKKRTKRIITGTTTITK